MVNRPKKQGTTYESALVTTARAYGLVARRLAEGGRLDEGDVEVLDAAGNRWVIEAKARAALNLHRALFNARTKCGDDTRVAVAWKRLVRRDGMARRVPDGEPAVVCVRPAEFFALLAAVADEQEGAA